MSEGDRRRWDEKWGRERHPHEPNPYLVRWRNFLERGVALDVACGTGQNSVFLAQHGYQVLGVDLSWVGLQRAQATSIEASVRDRTLFAQVDLDRWRPPGHVFDLVCVFRFLDRDLIPALKRSLRPGGVLLYQTRHVGLLRRQADANAAFLLQWGELLELFEDCETLAYDEGPENAAILVRKGLA